jgi:hypothetical protein
MDCKVLMARALDCSMLLSSCFCRVNINVFLLQARNGFHRLLQSAVTIIGFN